VNLLWLGRMVRIVELSVHCAAKRRMEFRLGWLAVEFQDCSVDAMCVRHASGKF
jgi:hypothetical protein